jgi:hypothetical protein
MLPKFSLHFTDHRHPQCYWKLLMTCNHAGCLQPYFREECCTASMPQYTSSFPQSGSAVLFNWWCTCSLLKVFCYLPLVQLYVDPEACHACHDSSNYRYHRCHRNLLLASLITHPELLCMCSSDSYGLPQEQICRVLKMTY